MTATCHLYDATTRERLCSCPCASVALAKMIATSRHHADSVNIVESDELCAGYTNSEMIFLVHTRAGLAQWRDKLQLTEPKHQRKTTTHDHQGNILSNIRRGYARHRGRRAAAPTRAAA